MLYRKGVKMAEKELTPVEQALRCITKNQSFIMKGGAGSGKTHSLIEIVTAVAEHNTTVNIACLTYTNVAVNEIISRIDSNHLQVATIHDFLWGIISPFQSEIKHALVDLINDGTLKAPSFDAPVDTSKWPNPIEYKDWVKLADGIISHDEVLTICEWLFERRPLLSRIFKDRYPYIFIDEYQDTPQEVVRILLKHLNHHAPDKHQVVGLFGDSMQSIYEDNRNEIEFGTAITEGRLEEISIPENRRNPKSVIDLINKLRDDGLRQVPSSDESAPNYGKQGSAIFLYSKDHLCPMDELEKSEYLNTWDLTDGHETKLLFLTKRLIAEEQGFPQLMHVYSKDVILDYVSRIKKVISNQQGSVDENATLEAAAAAFPPPKPSKTFNTFIEENPHLWDYAKHLSYGQMAAIYLDTDKLIGTRKTSDFDNRDRGKNRDTLITHLLKIQENIHLYQSGQFNQFIKNTEYPIETIRDKRLLKSAIEDLVAMAETSISIEKVIEFADSSGIRVKDDRLLNYLKVAPYVYERIRSIPYQEVVKLYDYVEDYTVLSTQHGVKGAEFPNVFVSTDNGNWRNYDYTGFLSGKSEATKEPIRRAQRMLYVCCSRARDNLVVYCNQPSDELLEYARKLFNDEKVLSI